MEDNSGPSKVPAKEDLIHDIEDRPERGIWSSKMDYLLSMIGYAVGLGNVWRFPYLAFKNGGGTFLIPYTVMLAIAGLPLFFLECSLGQFASLGPISAWRLAPIFQGVGCSMVLISASVAIYYNVIIAYSLYYFFASFRRVLPWTDCYKWADEKCSRHSKAICNITSGSTVTIVNLTWVKENNLTCVPNSIINLQVDAPSYQYWDKVTLRRSSGIGDTGKMVWYLVLCLLLAWILVILSLVKGIKSSGKVWKDAATQIFFSLSTAWGGLIALSSYNKFNNNCYLDSIIVSVTNCVTSVFAGFAVFSILGHMAHVLGKSVKDVAESGFGLAFIAYPEALTQLPLAPFWSILFFSMLITLGLDSQFALIETVTTAIEDAFPKAMKQKRIYITTGCCALLFLLGLPCVTQAGIYWLVLIDTFCGGWNLLFSAVLELIGISWIYGGNRFIEDIEMMIGNRPWSFWFWWRMCWLYVSPVVLAVILLWSLVTFTAPSYGPIQYPVWSIVLGWLMTITCLMWIPIVAIMHIYKSKGTLWEDFNATNTDENLDRENWSSKTEYLLAMIGYAVGLGNVWRFPYIAFKHGGGAFLIPFIIMLAIAGLPLFLMECSLGQFASLGPVEIWRIVPILQGVGITMVLISALVSIYYNVIVGYSLYYLFASFTRVLPWSYCMDWANENCSETSRGFCNISSETDIITVNLSWVEENNFSCIDNTTVNEDTELPSQQYWKNVALHRSGGLDETGVVVWHLALCLLLAWILVGASLFKGIKSSGKVVYFTAVFPYVVLIILLIRGATLEGARDGIDYFIGTQSDMSKLKSAEAWKDAATQLFYSLSTAWGGIVALSSYNKFHNNCYLDAIVVCVVNCLTSLFAGFAIFSIMGHMAFLTNRPVPQVVNEGFALAFMAYPEALTKLPVSPLWSILFFFMLVTLGLDSQFALIETITTAIQDAFPNAMKKMRLPITVGCCIFLFLLGLVCVTQAGIFWVNLIDYYCGGWAILIAAILEVAGICWIYGGNRFIKDIEMMLGKKSFCFWIWWRACWFFITPVVLIFILVWSLVTLETPTYDDITYPSWGEALGWCMIIFCIIWIPIIAAIKIFKAEGNLWQRIVKSAAAAPNWGPALEQNWGERYKHLAGLQHDNIDLAIPTVEGKNNASFQPEQ
uniref:Transporter n=1 Tax=Geotrypetes seraphini TaxID=260995 RepID=A0A6P8QWG6_GEOSA|nr:sodium- and chloride-dependent neutral and basic amino acid transporter B(0+)-like isoform X2 [Geotrypetes seraphini]